MLGDGHCFRSAVFVREEPNFRVEVVSRKFGKLPAAEPHRFDAYISVA